MQPSVKIKPGFVRVFIPSRNKTTRIRKQLAYNQDYMNRNGMVLLPEPISPVAPKPVTPPVPQPLRIVIPNVDVPTFLASETKSGLESAEPTHDFKPDYVETTPAPKPKQSVKKTVKTKSTK